MITIKEEFLSEEKTRKAIRLGGWEAIGMWLSMKSYAARKNTGGFIPDDAIDDLQGAPKSPRKALRALVDCGLKKSRDSDQGPGLVDKVDGGWQLHDYDDHGTDPIVEEIRREKRRLKKQRQRERQRQELERLQSETVSPVSTGRQRETVPGGQRVDSPRGHTVGTPQVDDPGTSRARAAAHVPSPAQPSPVAAAAASSARVPCPRDLDALIPASNYSNWAMSMGIPEAVARGLVKTYAEKYAATPSETRFTDAWIRGAVKVVMQDGVAAARKSLEDARRGDGGVDDTGGYGAAEDWA